MKSTLYKAICTCLITIAPALFCTPLDEGWELVPPLGAHRTLYGAEDSLRNAPAPQQKGEPTKKTPEDGWGWSDWFFLSMKKSHNTPAKKSEKTKDIYGDTLVTDGLSVLLDEALGNAPKVSPQNGAEHSEPLKDNPTHRLIPVVAGVVPSQDFGGASPDLQDLGDRSALGAKAIITNPVEPCAPSAVALSVPEGPQSPIMATQTAPKPHLSPDVQRSLDRLIQANASLLETIEKCQKSREASRIKAAQ